MGEGVVFQPQTREDIFDDPVYEAGFTASNSSYRPPATKKKSSSLERGMKVALREGGRERGREGGREGWKEGGREGGRGGEGELVLCIYR